MSQRTRSRDNPEVQRRLPLHAVDLNIRFQDCFARYGVRCRTRILPYICAGAPREASNWHRRIRSRGCRTSGTYGMDRQNDNVVCTFGAPILINRVRFDNEVKRNAYAIF